MLGASLYTAGLFLGLIITLFWLKRGEDEFDWRMAFGPMGSEAVIAFILLLWIIPYGALVMAPIILVLSLLSPAGRVSWKEYKKPRVVISLVLVLMMSLGSLAPVAQPIAPQDWGDPMFVENPYAPVIPNSEQYTWVLTPSLTEFNLAVVQSISIRVPYQLSPFMAESSALDLASAFGMEQERLHQAVLLLDEKLAYPPIDPDEILIREVATSGSYDYKTPDSESQELTVRVYEIRSLLAGSSTDGIKFGEVLVAAKSSWGGELQLLVVTRPIGHPDLTTDRFAETLVVDWLEAQ